MENLENKIRNFLSIGDGYGSGDGYGDGYGSGDGYGYGYGDGSGYGIGYGCGSGDGYGDGDGSGYGSGDGYGYGCGSGDGYGLGDGDGSGSGSGDGDGSGYGSGMLKEWAGQHVHSIDGIATLIDSVHGNYAKGRILKKDLTTESCFIAKVEGQYFAHGETLREAMADAMNKAFEDLPEGERIDKFVAEYPDKNIVAKNADLFAWHNRLTGSCEMGRRAFAKEHDIDVENGSMTVDNFIKLTINSYGGGTIEKLKERYK